jgi:hypothetical protein
MWPPTIESRISLTTILAALNLAMALIGGGAAYATIQAELRVAQAADARTITEIAALRAEGDRSSKALEVSKARLRCRTKRIYSVSIE